MKTKSKAKFVATMGLLIALSYAVMCLSKLIPINVAGFLTFDLKDVIIAIGGFIYGPISALIISILVSVIEMITISSTGPIGLLMNVLSTCAFVIPAALIYKKVKKFKGAIIGLVCSVVCMTIVMLLWNWLITPLYMGVSRETVVAMLPTVFLPFNLLKGGINAALTLVLYRPIVTALRKATLVEISSSDKNKEGGKKGVNTALVIIVGLVVFASLVLAVLVWQKII